MNREEAFARLAAATGLVDDFNSLTALGGRLAGSPSETAARQWLHGRLEKIPDGSSRAYPFPYSGWACSGSSLELLTADGPKQLACHALYWSAATAADGLESNLVDVGRGTETEFNTLAPRIPGRIVLVRHEYPFSRQTVHRSLKYDRSLQGAAAGFIIVNNNPGDLLVSGACSGDLPGNIPALGVSHKTGGILTTSEPMRVRMRVATLRQPATGVHLMAEVAGETPEWVVVCAHYDGHDVAQSALDIATGVAASLAIELRPLRWPSAPRFAANAVYRRGKPSHGSRIFLQSLDEGEQRKIALVLNLDTLAGSPHLTCLTSGFDELEGFVGRSCASARMERLSCYGPLMRNSDHFNFAQRGIPAIRLVAGFDEPEAGARFILTEADTSERVSMDELRRATIAAGVLVWSALEWPGRIASHKAPIAL